MVDRVHSKRRRIMRSFVIKEISGVDKPAMQGARMTLMKRDDSADVTKKYKSTADLPAAVRGALPDAGQRQFLAVANSALDGGGSDQSAFQQAWGALKNVGWYKDKEGDWVKKDYGSMSAPMAVQAASQEVQAVDFDAVLAEQEASEVAREVGDDLREKWCALQRSFATIAADESVAAPDKIIAMQDSLRQFIDSLSEQDDDIAESVTKSLSAVPAIAELLEKDANEGDDPMTDLEKKQLAELQKNVADLTKMLEAATAKEPAKKAADLQKELDDAAAKLDELTKKLEASDAEKVEAVAKAAMSDAEKAHLATLDGAAKMKFMTATPEERAKMMSKSADADPVIYKAADGVEFRKSDDPRLIAMAKRADEGEKLAKVEAKKREDSELAKRADDELKSFGETVAKRDDKIEALRAIDKMEVGARSALLKMLEVGGKAIAAAFNTIGHKNEQLTKSADDFTKKVAEIKKRDGLSASEALVKAREENPEAFAAYQGAGSN